MQTQRVTPSPLGRRAAAMAACYVPLYDMLCETIHAIKDDPDAGRELHALARRGRKLLDTAKARIAISVS